MSKPLLNGYVEPFFPSPHTTRQTVGGVYLPRGKCSTPHGPRQESVCARRCAARSRACASVRCERGRHKSVELLWEVHAMKQILKARIGTQVVELPYHS